MHACIHEERDIHIYTYRHRHTHNLIRIIRNVCIIHIHVHTHTLYIHTYVYIHTHTYIHMHKYQNKLILKCATKYQKTRVGLHYKNKEPYHKNNDKRTKAEITKTKTHHTGCTNKTDGTRLEECGCAQRDMARARDGTQGGPLALWTQVSSACAHTSMRACTPYRA